MRCKYYLLPWLLLFSTTAQAESFSYRPYLTAPKTLFLLHPAVNKDTGQVAVNGGDSRCATGPFTWDWGDGDVEDGWFPMQHIYADKERNYAVTVTAHYCDGTSDWTKAAIYFTVPSILPIWLPDRITVAIPSAQVNLDSRMPGYVPPPGLTFIEGACFATVPRETIEYVLTVAATIQMDFVDQDTELPDGSFHQVVLKDPSLGGGGMYSLWFTTPVSFAASCEAMNGTIQYSSFFHEMGHNVTLNFPRAFRYGGRIDGCANAVFSETLAQIFQHATAYEMVTRAARYGIEEALIAEIGQQALATFSVVRDAYQRYIDNGSPFNSWNDPATQEDETFDTFMTIAYEFIEHAENGGLGFRVPTRRFCDFLSHFNEDWHGQYSQHTNSVEAESYRATLFVAAVSYAFGSDNREEFAALNFPVDDQVYVQLMERVNEAPCGGLGSIEGDVNRDCRVDFEDFCTLCANWLQDWSI